MAARHSCAFEAVQWASIKQWLTVQTALISFLTAAKVKLMKRRREQALITAAAENNYRFNKSLLQVRFRPR